jgi:hypothetical protein
MRHVLKLFVAAAVASLALFVGAGTATAGSLLGGGCGEAGPVFSQWNDNTDYYFPTNGGFESGSTGWSLAGGAAVVSGNESYDLHSASDSHSLYMPSGSSASYNACYGFLFFPGFRFMAEGNATIHVSITTKNLLGLLSTFDGGTFTVNGSWDASPKISSLVSSLIAVTGAKSMQIHISVSGGSARIDDLYIDPFLTKC